MTCGRLSIDVIGGGVGGSGPAAIQFGRREKKTAPSVAAISDWEEGEVLATTTTVGVLDRSLSPRRGGRGMIINTAIANAPSLAAAEKRLLADDGQIGDDNSPSSADDYKKTSLLEIDIIEDEFSSVCVAESPNTKVRVVDHQSPSANSCCSPRKLVFSLHSPICQDEIRPMGSPLVLPDREPEDELSQSQERRRLYNKAAVMALTPDPDPGKEKSFRKAIQKNFGVPTSTVLIFMGVPTSTGTYFLQCRMAANLPHEWLKCT